MKKLLLGFVIVLVVGCSTEGQEYAAEVICSERGGVDVVILMYRVEVRCRDMSIHEINHENYVNSGG